jgi:hypothetical protein
LFCDTCAERRFNLALRYGGGHDRELRSAMAIRASAACTILVEVCADERRGGAVVDNNDCVTVQLKYTNGV